MIAMPSVDIAITSYQYARYLRQSASSVLSQDFTNLRLLIIDNASTDGSREVAQQIAASDKRVTLILNEENRGFIHSFNRAIDWAAEDYLVILDADDLLAPGSLSSSVAFLEKNPEVAFGFGIEGRLHDGFLDPARCGTQRSSWRVTDGHAYIRRTCWDSFCDIGAPAVIRRTSSQKKAGHYRSDLPRTCDFEMYLRLGLIGSVANTNQMLGIRRLHGAQLSVPYNARPVLDLQEHEAAFDSFFAHEGRSLPDAERLRRLAHVKLGEYSYWQGMSQWMRQRPDATESFDFAVSRRGKSNFSPPVSFLFKKRWLRSAWRTLRRLSLKPLPLGDFADHASSELQPPLPKPRRDPRLTHT